MYLSCLLIDVGTNPDRPRPGRLWLRNRYRVHQRLCMGFPTFSQQKKDPEFLMPFEPCGFPNPRPERCTNDAPIGASGRQCALSAVDRPIHVPRDAEHNFLFRVDPQPGCSVVILVLSAAKPDWDYAFHNARHLLVADPATKTFDPKFQAGQLLRFRLDANPTKRLRKDSRNADGQTTPEQWIGKRVPVPTDRLEDWLVRRAERNGFRIRDIINTQPGFVYVKKTANRDSGQRLRSVRYEGVLEVTESRLFNEAVIRGIGPAKAFGFGLLSVAPVR